MNGAAQNLLLKDALPRAVSDILQQRAKVRLLLPPGGKIRVVGQFELFLFERATTSATRPQPVSYTGFHRWRDPQRLVNANEIVIHENGPPDHSRCSDTP